jgi:serine/threonine protein kinase
MAISWDELRPPGGRPTPEWRSLLTRHLRENWVAGRPLLVEAYLEGIPELTQDAEGVAALLRAEVGVWGDAWSPTSGESEPHTPGLFQARLHGLTLPPLSPVSSLPLAFTSPLPLIDQFGRYNRHLLLGAGGMGEVYLAWDTWVERYVALKVIRVEDLPDSKTGSERLTRRQRFYKEAQALAAFDHPHLLRLQHYGYHDTSADSEALPEREPFLDLGYVPGPALAIYTHPWDSVRVSPAESTTDLTRPTRPPLTHRPPPLQRLAEIMLVLTRAMAYVHDRGSTHRDLKPSNIRFNRYGEPVIVDFGLARLPLKVAAGEQHSRVPRGTMRYMAPEAFAGDPGFSSDIYALGLILYELLTGEVPLVGMNWVDTYDRRREHDVIFLTSTLDPDMATLQRICELATRADPAKRFRTMHAFADALTGFLNSLSGPTTRPPSRSSRPRWRAAAAGLLVGCGLGATPYFFGWVERPPTVPPHEGPGVPLPVARTPVRFPMVIVAAKRYLDTLPPQEREFVRFVTIYHRHNTLDVKSDELDQYRAAAIDAVGAVMGSGDKPPVTAVPGTSRVLFAVNFKDHRAALAAWERIIRQGEYPYDVEFRGPGVGLDLAAADAGVRAATVAEVPIVRGDWLVSTAANPQLQQTWAGGGGPIVWPQSVRDSAAKYPSEVLTAADASADLDLESSAELLDAVRQQRLPAALFGGLTPQQPWVTRLQWEQPQPGSATSRFRMGISALSVGIPIRLVPNR